jgi:hypothetical protein
LPIFRQHWLSRLILGLALAFVKLVRADHLTLDFLNGAPPPNVAVISPITPSAQLDYSGGQLNVNLPNGNDALQISLAEFDPICFIFRGLSLNLGPGAAIDFGVFTGDELNSDALGVAISNTTPTADIVPLAGGLPVRITVKLIEQLTVNGQRMPPMQVDNLSYMFDLTSDENNKLDVDHIRVDCVSPGRFQFEFALSGPFNDITSTPILAPGVCGGRVQGFIQNLSGQIDPPASASVATIDVDSTHVPEPQPLALLAIGTLFLFGLHQQCRHIQRGFTTRK